MDRANQGVRWAGAGGAIQNMGNRGGSGQKVNSKIINKEREEEYNFNIQALDWQNVFLIDSLRDWFVKERKGENITLENGSWYIQNMKNSMMAKTTDSDRVVGMSRTKEKSSQLNHVGTGGVPLPLIKMIFDTLSDLINAACNTVRNFGIKATVWYQ